jgi:hypothetical protein
MKKIIIALSMLVTMAVMSACGSKTSSTTTSSNTTGSLSTEAELLVGTMKLEDTDLAVTAEQAKQLLPLWQTLQSLSSSNTAATQEINAVIDQIKSSMTSDQMAKITAMKLTQQDMLSFMMQSGVGPNSPSTTVTPMARGNFPSGNGSQAGGGNQGGPGGGGQPPSGAPPAGDFPAGGDQGSLGAGPNGQSSTPQAGQAPRLSNQVPQSLLNALIQLLQKKVQG